MSHCNSAIKLFIVRLGIAVGNVVANARVKQHRILGHYGDGASQTFLRDVAYILAINFYAAGLDIVKAIQQTRESTFTRARRTYYCYFGIDGNMQIKFLKDEAI